MKLISNAPEHTFELGRELGRILTPGIVIALFGDLGTGKTAFSQGIARGLDVPESYYITSPTYTLVNEYPGRCPFYHIDLYRLDSDVDFEDIGLYEIFQGHGVAAVEWADRLHKDALTDYLAVHIKSLTDLSRNIKIRAYGSKEEKLIHELKNVLRRII